MAFATAKFWGLMPHVIWRYPFRYYRELRDFYIATLTPVNVNTSSGDSEGLMDWDANSFQGDRV
jgi:hypothetical protein